MEQNLHNTERFLHQKTLLETRKTDHQEHPLSWTWSSTINHLSFTFHFSPLSLKPNSNVLPIWSKISGKNRKLSKVTIASSSLYLFMLNHFGIGTFRPYTLTFFLTSWNKKFFRHPIELALLSRLEQVKCFHHSGNA